MAMIERRLNLRTGLAYHLLEWDAPTDHTIVFLHGFLDFGWSFVRLIEAGLAGRYHVLAPDLRGHGDSDRVGPGGYYHFADYLPDLHDLIRQAARPRLSIVGHSMGGTVGSWYAGTFTTRVEKLVLLEGLGPPETPTPTGPERVASWIESWARVVERPLRTFESVDEAAARLREHDPLLDPDLAIELAAHGTAPVSADDGRLRFKHDPLHTTLGPYGGFRTDVSARFWSRIACPVLLVEGGASDFRHDPAEIARRIAFFRDLRRATLQGAGHMMQRHRPRDLAKLIDSFVG
jgi:pimeloyl-ACP methyl ester carboxylesterase